jgi:hypothetical protein
MGTRSTVRSRQREAGIALLISIFILLLISVVAIALVVSSGTESALAGNYRSATGVYYAALSGAEEARGRLLSKNPDAFKTTDPTTFLPPTGTALNMGDTYYLINPIGGEVITPWDSTSAYPDNQFGVEFGPSGFGAPTNPSKKALSVWNRNPLQSLNLPGPLYKWVRINAVSEKSLKIDFDGNPNSTTPLYYDGAHFSNSASAGPQVLELTSFAILPNRSQKLVQYLVAPMPVPLLPLPATLTLAGKIAGGSSTVAYSSPSNNTQFKVLGTNYDCNGNAAGTGDVPAIGVFNSTDTGTVTTGGNGGNGIQPASVRNTNYVGSSGSPDVEVVYGSFPPAMRTPAGLEAALQPIIQNKDVVITPTPAASTPPYLGTATGSDLTPLGMSATNPLTVIVNGNLDVSGWTGTGYGLLLVTGTFSYDPSSAWNGIILVIGQGKVNGAHHQFQQISGAMLVAKTRDSNNNPPQILPGSDLSDSSGMGASVIFDDHMDGYGIRYSSCWIQKSQPAGSYKILSFHEISQQ